MVHPSQTTMITRDRSIVERCFLMNLDRREDRLKEWLQQLPDSWPFPQPERFAAIDGRRCATPPQWKAGNGAWGCYRSHCLILEKCLIEGFDSYVVFEDDAGFVEDFAERCNNTPMNCRPIGDSPTSAVNICSPVNIRRNESANTSTVLTTSIAPTRSWSAVART